MMDAATRDLSRLMNRLEQKLLIDGPQTADVRRLRQSSFERNKVNANVEHARALLFRLEHDNPQNKGAATSAQQSERQLDLQDKRALIKRLQKRLDDLANEGLDNDNAYDDSDDSDDEDLVDLYAPAIPNLNSGIDSKISEEPAIRSQDAKTAAAAATLTSVLRPRKTGAADSLSPDTAATSGSRAGGPSAMPGNTSPFSPSPKTRQAANDQASTAQLLESHDSEQNVITDSLLHIASALKQSTLSFSDNLDTSNPLVDATAQALDKNVTGMEAAGKRMGALRRMTEGVGWWGRLSLFAKVGVLWVVAILVGLVLPKLRF